METLQSDDKEEVSEDESADAQSEREDKRGHEQQIMGESDEDRDLNTIDYAMTLSDLLCILLHMHIFIIIFITLEHHTCNCAHAKPYSTSPLFVVCGQIHPTLHS